MACALGVTTVRCMASFTDKTQNRNLSDVYVDLFKLYGIDRPTFGEGTWMSTGAPSGILTGT